mmetsp:Transcript_41803/g.91113  ORF Transcript_41803/g.91113 Transcript_41803/m.91113 type:complete len:216 (-) Transcript_41803:715-1362(-)
MTSGGAVAHLGMASMTGAKNGETKKSAAITMAVRPVRPPSAMPAHVSLWMITGEVPQHAPKVVDTDEAKNAAVDPGSASFSSSSPARKPIPNCTPAVSKIVTSSNDRLATMTCGLPKYPSKSNCIQREPMPWDGGETSSSTDPCQATASVGASTMPVVQAITVTAAMPTSILPLMSAIIKITISSIPIKDRQTSARWISPNVTKVSGEALMTPIS